MAVFAYMMLFITVAAFAGLGFVHWRKAMDRDRIASQLALHGWTLTSIQPAWSLFEQRFGRRYKVTYQAADGAEVQTRCETSMFIGVRWLDAPPPEPKR